MKKQTMITIIVIAIIAIIAIVGVVIVKNNNNTTNGGTSVKIESGKDMKSMLKSIYSENKDVLPELETEEIDVSNSDLVTSYTGIQSTGNVESLVVLEPLMSSQAYSAVALKVKSNANIETVKEKIEKDTKNISDNIKEASSELKENIKNEISIISSIPTDKKLFETKKERKHRMFIKVLKVLVVITLLFLWLWASIAFIAVLFAILDGVKIY